LVERRIVTMSDLPAFHAAVTSALRACKSVVLEAALLVIVYTLGVWLLAQARRTRRHGLVCPAWRRRYRSDGGRLLERVRQHSYLSLLLLRWYARLLIWFQLLWRISRLRLHLSRRIRIGPAGLPSW
jgi:hypothetical protein